MLIAPKLDSAVPQGTLARVAEDVGHGGRDGEASIFISTPAQPRQESDAKSRVSAVHLSAGASGGIFDYL
jgi:hypothetical protein